MAKKNKKELKRINESVASIIEMKNDDEAAHAAEDDLHQKVLRYISDNAPDPWSGLSSAALKTEGIDFARWCA